MHKAPGCGKQRMLSPHQLPHLHSDVAELIAQQAAEAHEGRGVAHDLLRLRHHLVPVCRGSGGLSTPGTHREEIGEGRPPQATRGTRGYKITGQAQQLLPKVHNFEFASISACPRVARGTEQGQG